jgi:hypothetical protein
MFLDNFLIQRRHLRPSLNIGILGGDRGRASAAQQEERGRVRGHRGQDEQDHPGRGGGSRCRVKRSSR